MVYTAHARQEMKNDDIGEPHILATMINGAWKYQDNGTKLYNFLDIFVVAAKDRKRNEPVIVTVWKKRQKK